MIFCFIVGAVCDDEVERAEKMVASRLTNITARDGKYGRWNRLAFLEIDCNKSETSLSLLYFSS